METEIKKYEELEKITMGQQVIIGNEGTMKYIGVRNGHDMEVGDMWSNPVFASKLENGDYKLIEVLTKAGNSLFEQIVDKKNQYYSKINNTWEEFKIKCHTI